MTLSQPNILVIKHGALGDFFFALGAMQHIAHSHPDSRIVLLTTAPYVALAEQTGFFDQVVIDERPPLKHVGAWLRLRRWARAQNFFRIYDLQNTSRTRAYMWAFFSPARWNGEARHAAFAYTPPAPCDPVIHQIERKRQQLIQAGLGPAPDPDLSFLKADLTSFELPDPRTHPYFLLIPGASPQGTYKKWPAERYGWIAQKLKAHGVTPVIIGSVLDTEDASLMQHICPSAINLCGKTTFAHIAALGRGALGVLGNDTGPFHIAWLSGCPAIGLFSERSDPQNCGPLGPFASILQKKTMADIKQDAVWKTIDRKCALTNPTSNAQKKHPKSTLENV